MIRAFDGAISLSVRRTLYQGVAENPLADQSSSRSLGLWVRHNEDQLIHTIPRDFQFYPFRPSFFGPPFLDLVLVLGC